MIDVCVYIREARYMYCLCFGDFGVGQCCVLLPECMSQTAVCCSLEAHEDMAIAHAQMVSTRFLAVLLPAVDVGKSGQASRCIGQLPAVFSDELVLQCLRESHGRGRFAAQELLVLLYTCSGRC